MPHVQLLPALSTPHVRGSLMWPTISLSLAPEAAENMARHRHFPYSLATGSDGTQYSGGGTQGAAGGSQRPSHRGGDSSITLATGSSGSSKEGKGEIFPNLQSVVISKVELAGPILGCAAFLGILNCRISATEFEP